MGDVPPRVHLLVEGQTEETVARQIIGPYLGEHGFWVAQSTLITSRPTGGPWSRGGVSSWTKIRRDIRALLRDSSLDVLTTMIDYYGFPADAPGMADRPAGGPVERVQHVEAALAAEVGDPR